MQETGLQYNKAIGLCKVVFIEKTKDYGTSWRVLRTISVVDQIYIKARRIWNIQEKKSQKIGDTVLSEWVGIVNYSIIGLIQLKFADPKVETLKLEKAEILYDEQVAMTKAVMEKKNHDYGEAWREMSDESMVDLILVKLLRIKQILSNRGVTLISEGIDANFTDILNYSVFSIIKNHLTTL